MFIIKYTDYASDKDEYSIEDYYFQSKSDAWEFLEEKGFEWEHSDMFITGGFIGTVAEIKRLLPYTDLESKLEAKTVKKYIKGDD